MRPGPLLLGFVLLAGWLSGCQLPYGRGPVSRSLATSRQLCQQGVAAIERNDWNRAEEFLSQAVTACDEDPDARRHYAEVLWQRGEREAAVDQLEQAGRLGGEDATLHVRVAQMRLAMSQTERARARAQHAVDLDPKLAVAWATRGRVRRALGQTKLALADFHRALGLAPDDETVQWEIAEVYRELDLPQRALTVLASMADAYAPGEEPQDLLYSIGLAYVALGRHHDAVESFSAALIRDRATPELLFQLAQAEFNAGRPSHAATAANEALALDPHHAPSRQLLDELRLALNPQHLK